MVDNWFHQLENTSFCKNTREYIVIDFPSILNPFWMNTRIGFMVGDWFHKSENMNSFHLWCKHTDWSLEHSRESGV